MFSSRLKILRNRNNMSQKELANELFVSQQTVAKWETNKSTPNPDMIVEIAEFFNTSTDYLLGLTDDPINNKNRATIIGFGDGRHIKTDMTYEDFEELEAMWRALKEKRKHDK